MSIASALLAFLLLRVTWWLMGCFQGAEPRSARLFFHRPLLGRWSSPAVKRLRAFAQHGPDAVLSRTSDLLSSPYPASRTADLGSAGSNAAQAFVVPLLLVSSQPDSGAFVAGVQLGIAVAFIVVAAFLGLSIVRKMLGQ